MRLLSSVLEVTTAALLVLPGLVNAGLDRVSPEIEINNILQDMVAKELAKLEKRLTPAVNGFEVERLMKRASHLLNEVEQKAEEWKKMKERQSFANSYHSSKRKDVVGTKPENKFDSLVKEAISVERLRTLISMDSTDTKLTKTEQEVVSILKSISPEPSKEECLSESHLPAKSIDQTFANASDLADVAAFSVGASIVPHLTSETFDPLETEMEKLQTNLLYDFSSYLTDSFPTVTHSLNVFLTKFGFRLKNSNLKSLKELALDLEFSSNRDGSRNGPKTAILDGVLPGDCWACKNVKGKSCNLTISLAGAVEPAAFEIEHCKKNLVGNVRSAPKDFAVYGFSDINSYTEEEFLGSYTFNAALNAVQRFERQNYSSNSKGSGFNAIKLEILSNHGKADYTCVYRFKVLA